MKKENSPRRFLSSFAVAMALMSLSVPLAHYIVDINRVLHPDYVSKYEVTSPNYRYLKTKYYLDHVDQYNNLIFGSSRVFIGMNTTTMNQVLGGSWYKMEYPGGNLKEHLTILKMLVLRKKHPENIILTLDNFSLLGSFKDAKRVYKLKPYPNTAMQWIDFYLFYLIRPIWFTELKSTLEPDQKKTDERLLGKTGLEGYDSKQKLQVGNLLLHFPYRHQKNSEKAKFNDVWLEIISEFIQLCKDNNIRLSLVYNPSHYKTLLARHQNQMDQFKINLAQLHPFYDFSTLNSYSIDNNHWVEINHYYNSLGKIIINEIKKENKSDFLVSRQTIHHHIKNQRAHTLKIIPQLLKKDKRIYLSPDLWKVQVDFLHPAQRKNITIKTQGAIQKEQLTLYPVDGHSTIHLKIPQPLRGYNMLFIHNFNKSIENMKIFINGQKLAYRDFKKDKYHYWFTPIPLSTKSIHIETTMKRSAKQSIWNQLKIVQLAAPPF